VILTYRDLWRCTRRARNIGVAVSLPLSLLGAIRRIRALAISILSDAAAIVSPKRAPRAAAIHLDAINMLLIAKRTKKICILMTNARDVARRTRRIGNRNFLCVGVSPRTEFPSSRISFACAYTDTRNIACARARPGNYRRCNSSAM